MQNEHFWSLSGPLLDTLSDRNLKIPSLRALNLLFLQNSSQTASLIMPVSGHPGRPDKGSERSARIVTFGHFLSTLLSSFVQVPYLRALNLSFLSRSVQKGVQKVVKKGRPGLLGNSPLVACQQCHPWHAGSATHGQCHPVPSMASGPFMWGFARNEGN